MYISFIYFFFFDAKDQKANKQMGNWTPSSFRVPLVTNGITNSGTKHHKGS